MLFASWNKCFFLFCLSRFINIVTTGMIANSHHTYRGCTAILVGNFNGKGISYHIWCLPLTQGLETASGILELARQIIAQLPLSAKPSTQSQKLTGARWRRMATFVSALAQAMAVGVITWTIAKILSFVTSGRSLNDIRVNEAKCIWIISAECLAFYSGLNVLNQFMLGERHLGYLRRWRCTM